MREQGRAGRESECSHRLLDGSKDIDRSSTLGDLLFRFSFEDSSNFLQQFFSFFFLVWPPFCGLLFVEVVWVSQASDG